ncbi:uncharacterized protein BCR38DRAFT_427345 [Pseudomassariella vexata]|uniref:Uncharacterized protein n=1 Tax=Pseudomassariella vexata TaxID=1141098 RepID=A0A1Y2E8C2_9PEZI|nr:uncharacterized protein BCR38DRAFT_427345 [Pseudomassariella vexata]ORY67526.1 hypothetical protein BCR38DRAFT_427345 [Pseudomassariella vexata]
MDRRIEALLDRLGCLARPLAVGFRHPLQTKANCSARIFGSHPFPSILDMSPPRFASNYSNGTRCSDNNLLPSNKPSQASAPKRLITETRTVGSLPNPTTTATSQSPASGQSSAEYRRTMADSSNANASRQEDIRNLRGQLLDRVGNQGRGMRAKNGQGGRPKA